MVQNKDAARDKAQLLKVKKKKKKQDIHDK